MGLWCADVIDGGDGDDVIYGDGTYTVGDAVASEGRAVVGFDGTVSNSNGLLLTAMGMSGTNSVWRIRNASNSDLTVMLESPGEGKGGRSR